MKSEGKYIASGNVKIRQGTTTITADQGIYFEETADAELKGTVTIEDPQARIVTDEATYNIDDNTGSLNNGVIYFRKGNYWVSGSNMQKIGENHYFAKTAYFTTCDTEEFQKGHPITDGTPGSQQPDWCFKGEDADIVFGEGVTARQTTYRIRNVPVLYTPYFWGPVGAERATGFLMPRVGMSSSKGLEFDPKFFWAIDENKDATFGLDYYSRRGIGKSIEYRYLDTNQSGIWHLWHLYDTERKRNYLEAKVSDKRDFGDLTTFVDVKYVNHDDLYKEYSKVTQTTIQRFMQSSAEASLAFNGGRTYLLGQYWVNLREGDTAPVLQRLPEAGVVINPVPLGGSLVLSLAANAANFTRDQLAHGERFDIMPMLTHSVGDTVRFTQSLALRETAYHLMENGSASNPHRESLRYNAQVQTRLTKAYDGFLHIMEPSLEYTYLPKTKTLPVFDSTELFGKTSVVQAGLFNRFLFPDYTLSLRLAQPYDLHGGGSDALLPTTLEGALNGSGLPVSFVFDLAYALDKTRFDTAGSSVGIKLWKDATLWLGERYLRTDNLLLLTAAFDLLIDKKWQLKANTWYDMKGGGLRDSSLSAIYKQQCWEFGAAFTRRPGDTIRPAEYVYSIFFELKGLGMFRVR